MLLQSQTDSQGKSCTRCKKWKRLEEFYPKRNDRDSRCIECKKELDRERTARKRGQVVEVFRTSVARNLPKQKPQKVAAAATDFAVWESLYGRKLEESERREIKTNLTAFLALMIDETSNQLSKSK